MKVTISNRQRKVRLSIRQIEKDCRKLLRLLGLQRAELSVLMASSGRMRRLNFQYRGVDATTDVMAFPLYESASGFPGDAEFLLGDIALDPARAKEQAAEYGATLKEELRRLLVHGLLHLLGYEHEKSDYLKRKMRKKERELLEALGR